MCFHLTLETTEVHRTTEWPPGEENGLWDVELFNVVSITAILDFERCLIATEDKAC